MKINIFGSTGEIGKKSLKLIYNSFPDINVNLLCANSNIKLLIKQIKIFNPKYVYVNDLASSKKIKSMISNKTKIFSFNELNNYLKNSKSDLSLLAISGYKSLYYLDQIIFNTKNLGIVSKEAIVSAGHIFKKKKYFNKTNIFPIDSEHYSLFEYFSSTKSNLNFRKVVITASGGPFYKTKYNKLHKIKFQQAIKHPKWKMGYKNSIDSATLVNKCLEVIEAHYLFNIPFEMIKIVIHPEALVHSIIEKDNYILKMNLFKNDMAIPILNFLKLSNKSNIIDHSNLRLKKYDKLTFLDVKSDYFPIYDFFIKMDKSKPANLIKFNIGNEFAVNMFKNNLIKYTDICKIIKKVCALNLNSELNTIKDIIEYHEHVEKKVKDLFKYSL